MYSQQQKSTLLTLHVFAIFSSLTIGSMESHTNKSDQNRYHAIPVLADFKN